MGKLLDTRGNIDWLDHGVTTVNALKTDRKIDYTAKAFLRDKPSVVAKEKSKRSNVWLLSAQAEILGTASLKKVTPEVNREIEKYRYSRAEREDYALGWKFREGYVTRCDRCGDDVGSTSIGNAYFGVPDKLRHLGLCAPCENFMHHENEVRLKAFWRNKLV